MISEEKLRELRNKFSEVYIDFHIKELKKKRREKWYEKLCDFSSKILRIDYKNKKLLEDVLFSGLNVSPSEVLSSTILSFLFLFLLSIPIYFYFKDIGFFIFLIPVAISFLIYNYPSFKAQVNRIQSGGEAVKIITYLVLYLEQNPNFEAALEFASKKSQGVFGEDIRKMIWDLKIGRFSNLKEAIEYYIPKWIKWNENFVRALLLLSGVSFAVSQEERKNLLRKALDYILSKNLEESKVFAEKVRGPINLLFMFGLLMPTIGLIMFPLVSVFLHFSIKPGYLIFGYLVLLPLLNLYLIFRNISFRPGAYFVVDISKHPNLPPDGYFYFKKTLLPILPLSILVFLAISFFGFLHFIEFYIDYYKFQKAGMEKSLDQLISRENDITNIGNLVASFSIPFAFGVSLFLFFYLNSYQKTKIRREIKNMEEDLSNLLITVGNLLESGYSFEKTIEKTIEEYERLGMKEKLGYKFFVSLKERMIKFGENVNFAIFGSSGIIKLFPSSLLEESFRMLLDAVSKNVRSAGVIAKTIARYLENIFQVEFRLKELLSDIRGNLKLQAQILIPIITGIVAATGIFIVNLLAVLGNWLESIERGLGIDVGFKDLINILVGDFKKVIPLTVLQSVVGCYTIIAIVLMSYLLSGIESGFDKIARDFEIAENLRIGLIVYFIVGVMSLIIFSHISSQIKIGLS